MLSCYQELMNEYDSIINLILDRTYLNCLFLLGTLVGSMLLGISIYDMLLNGGNTRDLIMFSFGLFMTSPLIISVIILISLRSIACIMYVTCGDSKPIVVVPVAAVGDRSGRPKSNSPLSVLRVV